MPDTEAARMLVSAARRDLQALENMLDAQAFPGEIFGFHAQQAAEKTLKAWLILLDQEYPLKHNIRQLVLLLEKAGINIEPLWKFVELNAFAVQFRYEAYEDLDETLNRPELLGDIRELVSKVQHLLQSS